MREAVSLRQLYEVHSDRIKFLVIYIREAHGTDGWDIGSENRISDPDSMRQRRAVAAQCEVALQYGIHTYVDEIDDPVMTSHAAWPERLYLVDESGSSSTPAAPVPAVLPRGAQAGDRPPSLLNAGRTEERHMPKSTLSLAAARRLSVRTQSLDHHEPIQGGKSGAVQVVVRLWASPCAR